MGVDDAPKKNKLVVSEGATVTLNGDIDDQADVPIQIYGTLKVSAGNNIDAIFTNTINGVTNNAVVNITAGEKGISITKGSIVISGTIDVAEEATIDAEGTVRIDGAEITGDSGLTVTVTEGGKSTVMINNVDVKGVLSISGDVTVTGTMNVTGTVNNEGNMTVNGTMNNNGTVANTGTVEFTSSAKYNGGASDNKIQNDDSDNAGIVKIPAGSNLTDIATGGSITTSDGSDIFGMKGELEGDYPVSNAYLSSTLTIPEGKTLTVKGTLDLRGQTLIVKGKLIIESKGVIAGDIEVVDGKVLSNIVLSKTGVIENKGLIGANSFVKVTDEQGTPASVTMKNVTGVEFSLTKETTNYILTVSGNAAKKGTENTFDINNAYISDLTVRDLEDVTFTEASVVKNGSLNIGSKAIVAIGTEMTLLFGAVLTIDGELTDAKVIMYLGSTANINGVATTPFKAMTGDYATYNDDDGSRYNIDLGNYNEEDEVDYSTITSDNLKGFVIDITSKTYTDDDENSRTVQMMNVSGQSAVADKEATDIKDSITVEGEVYVAKGTELIISKDTSIVATGVVVTEGTLRIVEVTSGIDNYEGAEYYVKVTPETGSPYTDYIYTDFDSALAVIDTVENKTVTLKGGYTFSKSFTVAAGQEIKFEDMSAEYKISKDATVTVEADGTMSVGFAQKGIMGTLVVKDGATCTPVEGSYEVSSKDANDNYTYTSAASAIENAKAGETIYITSNVEFPENIVIPEGVTVDIANGQTVTAKKDMTVNGKILNNGNISVEQALRLRARSRTKETLRSPEPQPSPERSSEMSNAMTSTPHPTTMMERRSTHPLQTRSRRSPRWMPQSLSM